MNTGWKDVPELTPSQVKQLIDTGEPLTLIDVREPREWNASNLGRYGAQLIPLAQLPARLQEIPRDARIVVYCRTGARSDRAVRFMMAQGFDDVSNLVGGINAWAEDVDPDLMPY